MIVKEAYDFKTLLKEIRMNRGYSQKDLGARCGIDPNRISNWELGYSKPALDTFVVLCVALNCMPGDLLGIGSASLAGNEYKLLKGFRKLDEAGQHTMMAVLESQLHLRSLDDD